MTGASGSRRTVALLVASSWIAAALAATAPAVIARLAALGPSITSATTPLDLVRLAPTLILAALPAAVAGTAWLVLTPGLIVSAVWARPSTPGHWLAGGLAISIVLVSGAVEGVEAALGAPLEGATFAVLVAALASLCATLAWSRPDTAPWHDTERWWPVTLPFLVGPWILLVAMAPKFVFEAFNGDGAHTFEATRLLLRHAVAFFGPEYGGVSGFPGMNSVLFTYPGAWFLRLFGQTEAAVRLPFLLYLGVLGPALLTAASVGGRRPRAVDAWLVMASLSVYAVVLAYSATYDPYCADIALPATQDTLFLVLLMSLLTASLEDRPSAMLATTVLGATCSQAWAAMCVFWLGARWLVDRRMRGAVVVQAVAVVAGLVAVAILGVILQWAGAPAPGGEHGLLDLLKKFATLEISDVRRLLFVLVPAGLYPVLALPSLRRRVPALDAMALLFALSFALYYVMAYYSLHYFVPSMVLALLVFWRSELGTGAARGAWFPPVAAALTVVSLYLSWPIESGIYTASREIGQRIDVSQVHGYDVSAASAYAHTDDLSTLFPKDIEPEVPGQQYGGSPLAFFAYAQAPAAAAVAKAYRVAPRADGSAWDVSVLDAAQYARDRVAHPRGSRGAPLYDVPRDLLFMRTAEHAGFPVLDFRPLAKRLFPNLATRH
ncbi:MAG: hypothetical protein U0P30_11270 [Vicinamibacterales bacterium]